MAAVAHLTAHPELPRPTLRVAFTPDEEIGQGATLFDIPAFGARCAYTIDGSTVGELQDESFSAIEVRIKISGRRRASRLGHGQAGQRAAGRRADRRGAAQRPADARDDLRPRGLHPPDAAPGRHRQRRAALDRARLRRAAARVACRSCCARPPSSVVAANPGAELEFEVIRQYRNMREYIERDPDVIDRRRGGARGPRGSSRSASRSAAAPTARGCPRWACRRPNIFDGGHEYHSVREWASLQDMAASAATLVRLAETWSRR